MTKQHTTEGFIPEDVIPIDAEHSLDQMTSRFQTIKDGLPELIKNSKDHYLRIGIGDKDERQIVIIVSKDLQKLGVLDFGGAKADDFSGWKEWSSRTAGRNQRSSDIEAGHGNGGKAFMARGCNKESSMCGYRDGKINKMGFRNDRPELRYRPGHFTDSEGHRLEDYRGVSAEDALNGELGTFEIDISDLPEDAKKIFLKRKSFTFVHLNDIREWTNLRHQVKLRASLEIEQNVIEHPQAALTLEMCTVWLVSVATEQHIGPLIVSDLDPFESLEAIDPIPIPDRLIDPETNEQVSTGPRSTEKKLYIKTSKKNLRIFDKLKPRNAIRIKNERNIVASWSMAELCPIQASSFIYGSLCCPSITSEYLAGSDRVSLVEEVPLVRALKHWTTKKVEEVANQIHRLQSTRTSENAQNAASETLKQMRELMKQFLEMEEPGQGGVSGQGNEGSGQGSTRQGSRRGSNVNKIILETEGKKIVIGNGTTVPLVVKCYEEISPTEKKPVTGVQLVLKSEEHGLIQQIGRESIQGLSNGEDTVWFETVDGNIASNKIKVRIVDIARLGISPIGRILKQGERIQLDIQAYDNTDSAIEELTFEAHVDESEMGKIGRSGMFTAGGVVGTATVRIRYGAIEGHTSISIIEIGDEEVERTGTSDNSGVPLILLCGSIAPGREDLQEAERTCPGGDAYPTIIDFDPLWEGIVWINPDSRESKRVRSRGHQALLGIASKTFQQFLALKCFEILKRLRVREQSNAERKTSTEFFNAIADAELETAGFLEAAYGLVERLTAGEDVTGDD